MMLFTGLETPMRLLSDGTHGVDYTITSSGSYNAAHDVLMLRPVSGSAFIASPEQDAWFLIDLLGVHYIVGFTLFTRTFVSRSDYVTSFSIGLSTDGVTYWNLTKPGSNGQVKVFPSFEKAF